LGGECIEAAASMLFDLTAFMTGAWFGGHRIGYKANWKQSLHCVI
jgi:hypothetical protein